MICHVVWRVRPAIIRIGIRRARQSGRTTFFANVELIATPSLLRELSLRSCSPVTAQILADLRHLIRRTT
jgi:hypothetical protein